FLKLRRRRHDRGAPFGNDVGQRRRSEPGKQKPTARGGGKTRPYHHHLVLPRLGGRWTERPRGRIDEPWCARYTAARRRPSLLHVLVLGRLAAEGLLGERRPTPAKIRPRAAIPLRRDGPEPCCERPEAESRAASAAFAR